MDKYRVTAKASIAVCIHAHTRIYRHCYTHGTIYYAIFREKVTYSQHTPQNNFRMNKARWKSALPTLDNDCMAIKCKLGVTIM